MKILLINPSSENEIIGNNPAFIEEERGYNPPLGLLYIASYLEEFTQYSVEVLDTQVEEVSYQEIEGIIREKQPDVVGITAMTGLLLLGVLSIMDIEVSTNILNTGITLGIIFGIACLGVSLAIYKNWI